MQIWSKAKEMAEVTPPERNRYVDFLRAISILVVVCGHWMVATAYYADGGITPGHVLKLQPGTQWMTWIFQVMPIFFIVGGYSNAVSLESARRRNIGYAGWLATRLNRLVGPLLVLIVAWGVIALIMRLMGVTPNVSQYASKAALVPTWFLAIYIVVVMLAPLAYSFWRRFGFASFWVFVALAGANDLAFFAADMTWLGWTNYFWVWLAVHHLGFAWRDNRMGSAGTLLLYSALAFGALYVLIRYGPYPLAMVGSPDEGLSNTLPPKITLVALGMFQFGLLLSLENPMRRALSGVRVWAATVLINSMIMTVYLWHMTVMAVFVALLFLAGGFWLDVEPATSTWWLLRPLWIAVLMVLLVIIALPLSVMERGGSGGKAEPPSAPRQIVGAIMICLGIAFLALFGYGGGPLPRLALGGQEFDVGSFLLVIVGAALSGLLPGFSRRRNA